MRVAGLHVSCFIRFNLGHRRTVDILPSIISKGVTVTRKDQLVWVASQAMR